MNTGTVSYNTSLITAVIDENPFISQDLVQGEEVMKSSFITSHNYLIRNRVTSCFNAFLNPTNRQFRRTKPKKHQSDLVPFTLKPLDQRCENLRRESGFESKRVAAPGQLIDALEHDSTGLNGSPFRIERGNPFCDLICIHKFSNIQSLFQHAKCGGCLTSSIATREHNQSFHQCLN